MKILVTLPRDRRLAGHLFVVDDAGEVALAVDARGKADNARAAKAGNPSRDPTRPYGDTPSGAYAPTRLVVFAPPHPRLGRAWFPIEGGGGDALQARLNGRTGLGIHGGRGDGALVATYGCVRLRDRDMKRVAELALGRTVEVEVRDL